MSLGQEISALDKAEWTTWPHAYGSARDTPGHLAALLGDDEEAQLKAARHFSSAIVHQATVWPSSADAFAWLIRVLREKSLPTAVLDECVGALVEAAEYLGDIPSDTPVPELSTEAREWLERFGEAPEDEYEVLWEDFSEYGLDQEVYDWGLARMATLRPAVLALATQLPGRPGDDLRGAWETE
jgi:hypothetical protein